MTHRRSNIVAEEALQSEPMAPNYEEVPAEEYETTPLTNTETVAARQVHPDARATLRRCPWMRHIPVYGKTFEGYGWKTTWSLGLCYLLCKGISDYTLRGATYAMLRNRYGIDAMRYQRLLPISNMGWSIKAFTAMLCDAFAFLGYTKRWYMLLSCVAGAVFSLIYGLLPAKKSSADVAAAFIFLASYGKANVDILSEGHYSRLMRRNPDAGPALVSWIWWYIMIGSMISSIINGPLADAGIPQVSIFIATATQFLTSFFFIFNWYGERTNRVERAEDARLMHEHVLAERARMAENRGADKLLEDDAPHKNLHPELYDSDDEAHQHALTQDPSALQDELQLDAAEMHEEGQDVNYTESAEPIPCLFGLFEFNKEVMTRNWKVFVYSIIMTCAVVAMLCANILADTKGLLIVSIVISVVCCGFSLWALPRVIAMCNVYGYLQQMLAINIGGAGSSFFLADADCVPDGPHFSFTLMDTVGGVISTITSLVGITAFNYIFSRRSYRLTFVVTTFIQVVANIFDLTVIERWNEAIGIPDRAMYICGDAIVASVIQMLNWMPMVVLLSRLCPRGSESVVYALMAGFSNLGQTTAASIGAIIMEYGWPVNSNPPCDFSNLPWLVITCSMGVPLLVIPLTFLMIPNARVCDDIDVDGKVVKKHIKKQDKEMEKQKKHLDEAERRDDSQ